MAIRSTDELMQALKTRIDGTSDEDLALLEDLTDSLSAVDRSELDTLKSENDELRRKYRERFFAPGAGAATEEKPEPEPELKLTFESLFL